MPAKSSKISSQMEKGSPVERALRNSSELSKQEAAKLAGESIAWLQNLIASDLKGRRRLLLTDLANCNSDDSARWFWNRWSKVLWPESHQSLVDLANDLRALWQIDHAAALEVAVATGSLSPQEDILNHWLMWRPSEAEAQAYRKAQLEFHERSLRRALRPEIAALTAANPEAFRAGFVKSHKARTERSLQLGYTPFSCSLQPSQPRASGAPAGQLIPDPLNLRGMLIQGVFENWSHFKQCANATCAAPYFIAKRSDQLVCEAGPCKAQRQREHSLKWWNANRAKSPTTTRS